MSGLLITLYSLFDMPQSQEAEYELVEECDLSVEDSVTPREDINIIEVGDSIKMKQTLDDVIPFLLSDAVGMEQDVAAENWKLMLMTLGVIVGLVTQFYPIPFPANSYILGAGCIM